MEVFFYGLYPCFNPRSRTGSDLGLSSADFSADVSIHAPARGATLAPRFASRSRMVSIHAPARGATFTDQSRCISPNSFNPRSRTGSDKQELLRLKSYLVMFQSTLPHGERPRIAMARRFRLFGFNPRSRTGSDHQQDDYTAKHQSFNPRSRTGSDFFTLLMFKVTASFNPRSRTGSDVSFLYQG